MGKKKFRYLLPPEDYELFFEKALKIIDFETGKVVPFKINPIQRRLLYNWSTDNLVLKARRHGISTLLLAVAFVNCISFKNYKAAFIAHTKDDAESIFEKAHFFLQHLPAELKQETDKESTTQLSFASTGSKIKVSTAGAKSAKRGSDLNFIHFFWFQ